MKRRIRSFETKISIVLLRNVVDKSHRPIGHCRKQIIQTYQILRKMGYQQEQIEIVASRDVLSEISIKNKVYLPFSTISGQDCEMVDTIKVIGNYLISNIICRGEKIWYVLLSEVILDCIGFSFGGKFIIGTTFDNWNTYVNQMIHKNGMRKWLLNRGLKRLDLCIATNYHYHHNGESIRMPDYFRTEKQRKASEISKERYVLCVGEMRNDKDLSKLIYAFEKSDSNIKLVIKGVLSATLNNKFKRQYKNVVFEDVNLSEEQYLTETAKAKYMVLPYDMGVYRDRTSGVLLDCIFVGGIPIAPLKLLENNRVHGIGYKDIMDIPNLIMEFEMKQEAIINDLNYYELDRMAEALKEKINVL